MEPRIVYREAFNVLGLQERFTPNSEDHEGIWERFMAHHERIKALSADGGEAIDYLAGMAVADVVEVPDGLTLREIPASRYAVFECTVQTIDDTYD